MFSGEEPRCVRRHEFVQILYWHFERLEDSRHRITAPIVIRIVRPEVGLQLALGDEGFLRLGSSAIINMLLTKRRLLLLLLLGKRQFLRAVCCAERIARLIEVELQLRIRIAQRLVRSALLRNEILHAHVVSGGGHLWCYLVSTTFRYLPLNPFSVSIFYFPFYTFHVSSHS
jgi:hypothetical protein